MYKLSNESCFDFLPLVENDTVDLALIDPPYEISRDTGFSSGKEKGDNTDRFRISMDFGNWDNSFNGFDYVIKEIYRILKPSGTLICFYDLWKITVLKTYIF